MSEMGIQATGSLDALARFGPSAETLWSRIAPIRSPSMLRRILFVGSGHGCGTSTAACSAAAGLARNLQAKVMLVEIGLGSSSMAQFLGLPDGPGFYELLCASASLKGCVRNCGLDGLSVVTAGRGPLPPGQLSSGQARSLFEQLGAGQDYLVIDVPPLEAHSDLQPILSHVDEAVLVFEAERTKREDARKLTDIVSRAGVRVIGSVLNRARD